MKKALLDGDILLYRSAFAAERAKYILRYKEDQLIAPGTTVLEFDSKKELDAYVQRLKIEEFEIEKTRVIEPLEHALGNTKEILEKILSTLETTDYALYLTGTGNFRRCISSYKANRDPSMKPYWMDDIIAYMVKYWGATVVEGMEADDAIGLANNDNSIIVSTDKDLDTLPGWHYNWVKQQIYEVSADEADVNFWTQMLTGDRSDNVTGVPKVGPVSASKLLSVCRTPTERRDAVLAEYAGYYGHDEAAKQFSTNAVLLRICRTKKELEDNTKLAEMYGVESTKYDANGVKLNEQDVEGTKDNQEASVEGTGTSRASSGTHEET